MLAIIVFMNLATTTRRDVAKVKDFVDKQTIKQAWLQSKQSFIQQKGIQSRDEMVSYKDWWLRRYQVHNYVRAW
jgi:hypothetical protein